jgi:hypothetical protein
MTPAPGPADEPETGRDTREISATMNLALRIG